MVLDARGLDRGIPILLTWLVRDNAMPADKVPRVLDAMAEQSVTVEEAVIGLTTVGEMEIAHLYATYFHVVQVSEDDAPDPGAGLTDILPEAFCRQHLMVPIQRSRIGVVLAMVDPSRVWLHEQIALMTGLDVEVRVGPLSLVARWIMGLWSAAETRPDA